MGVQFAGNILVQSNGEPLPIASGGTGQVSAPLAINALLPTQTGQSGKILVTNGTNISWSSVTMTPGGTDTNIQFNDSGSFGGNAFFVVNKSTGALTSSSTFKGIGLTISDSDALTRTLRYQTLGSDRWLMMANNTTEAGAASGSDFALVRVADNGATTNIVYEISRATGVFDFKVAPTVNGSAISSSTAASALTGTTLASNVVSSSLTSVGTLTSLAVTGAITTNSITVGYLIVPQNSNSAAYTTVLADSGKFIYHPGADTTARTFTIDGSLAYPVGTAITFVNDTSAGVVTIAISTDTLVLAGAGTTGSRTLAANGMATALKMATGRWIISGTGLT